MWHFPSQHLSPRHLSISGIYQLLLTQFWPNFKSRFLGQSLTDANCQGDICLGNISPDNFLPYQHNFSFYWPNFDQNFVNQFFRVLIFVDLHFLWQNFFGPKYLLDQKYFCSQKLFWPKMFLDQIFFGTSFWFCTLMFFGPQFFLDPNFVWNLECFGP